MTTLSIDGVQVVFEGLARLRWTVGAWRLAGPGKMVDGGPVLAPPVLDRIWPDRVERSGLGRRIANGQKSVVVVDARPPVVSLPRWRVPRVPSGAEDLGGGGPGECRLLVVRFDWLRDRDRRRGDAFLDRAGLLRLPTVRRGEGAVVIERDLVGTREPLRFVYCEQPMSLDRLRLTIEHVFGVSPPHVRARPGTGSPAAPSGPAILAA